MVSFLLSLVALVLGYLFYGKFVAHVFGPDDRPTPAVTKADGVDFIVLPSWKIFMIQFLNIAGTGPIFGAIMGAWYGPVAYLWIVLGCIFAGAISGFHATQSPLMARCMKSEKLGRPIFYGSMITEGIVALIWATVSMYFFYYGGWREVVSPEVVQQFTAQDADGGKTLVQYFDAPTVVKLVCSSWLGVAGGVLALLGVVAAPITSGDTAFRSARLIIAEAIGLEQHSMHRRLYICIPMFVAAILLLVWQMNNPDGFNVIWQYFGWANQTLSVFTLWTLTVYLVQRQKPFIVTLVPALFMTVVCSTFLLISKQALGLQSTVAYTGSIIILVLALVWFFAWYTKYQRTIHS